MPSPLDCAIQLAREAGRIQRARLNTHLTIESKGGEDINLVTEVDHAIDAMLVAAIRRQFPSHAIVSEEGQIVLATANDDVWYVDPLDGTVNYAHGYPVFAVSIAYWRKGQPVAGVVYDANHDELFTAERGAGAFANGTRLRVSQTDTLSHALIATGFPYDRVTNPDNNYAQFARVVQRAQSVRRMGAAAIDLAQVAQGKLDGHWERALGVWDCAAAALMILEAGGRLSGLHGEVWKPGDTWLVATNGLIHDELVATLRGAG